MGRAPTRPSRESPSRQGGGAARWLALLLGLVALAAFGAPPLYRAVKEYRAEHLAARALDELRAGDAAAAASSIRAALALSPGNAGANRATALLQAAAGNQRGAAARWALIFGAGKESFADVRHYFDALMKSGRRQDAWELVERHSRRDDAVPAELAKMRCVWLVSGGEIKRGLAEGRRALRLDPSDDAFALYLAGLLSASEEPADHDDGLALLWSLAQKSGPQALGAAATLAAFPAVEEGKLARLVEVLGRADDRSAEREILRTGLRLRLGAPPPEAVAELVRRCAGLALEEKLRVAKWLVSTGQGRAALDLLPEQPGLFSSDYFRTQIEACAAAGDWAAAARLLSKPELPLPRHEMEAYRARVAEQTQGFAASEAHWSRAKIAAEIDPRAFVWLANIAESYGWVDRAREICRRLAQNPLTANEGYTGLIQIEKRHGTTRSLRDLMRELEPYGRDSELRINAEAYLSLLLGEDVERSAKAAGMVAEKRPGDLAFQATLALAKLRERRPDEAVQVLQQFEEQIKKADPVFALIYAAALAKCGLFGKARTFLDRVDPARLRPEEHILYTEAGGG